MNKKRIAALVAASAMLLTAMPVYADTLATSGSVTVTGSADISSYDHAPILEVTLPTARALDFTVDPYGLLEIASGEAVDLDDLPNTGTIATASGSGAILQNESSVPVTVTITFSVSDSTSSLELATSAAAVATGSSASMFLGLVPSANKITIASGQASGYKAASKAIGVTGSSNTAKFYLAKATYEVVNTGSGYTVQKKDAADNYDATMLQVSGYANPEADWSNLATGSAVSLNAVFDVKQAEDGDEVVTSGIYGLVSGSATTLVEFEAPTSGPKNLKVTVNGSVNQTVTLDSSNVSSIVLTAIPSGTVSVDVTTQNAKVSRTGTTLTIMGSWLTTFQSGQSELTVTYSDGKKQKIIVTKA